MILTSDKYPREIDGLEDRLKSRFVWGLTVEVEAPDLETRVAILMKKAEAEEVALDHEVAFFIAERIRSNVRELEGALRRVIANARFTGSRISIEQVRRALRDLFAIQDRQISIDNIQRTTAEYFNIKIGDLLSKRRNRSIARPRQLAMALAKELTNHSLPEIGDAFGGRDHTTVLHACRKVVELRSTYLDIAEDYKNLSRLLSGSRGKNEIHITKRAIVKAIAAGYRCGLTSSNIACVIEPPCSGGRKWDLTHRYGPRSRDGCPLQR